MDTQIADNSLDQPEHMLLASCIFEYHATERRKAGVSLSLCLQSGKNLLTRADLLLDGHLRSRLLHSVNN